MASCIPTFTVMFVVGFLIYGCSATMCSTESDCRHFEHCCKGNCTSKQFQCKHICSHDHHCERDRRCVLGLCVNCTQDISCDVKKCSNDTHCPGTHSCDENVCSLKKPNDLMAEMVPFIIFITALSVSLLIVCYNDYVLERLRHRGCTECIDNTLCSCGLILRIWMWRHQRLQRRNPEPSTSCPVEVQFDSRILNPSNSFNEKRETGFSWSLRTLRTRLMFWRHFNGNSGANSSSQEANFAVETGENSPLGNESSVVLLDEFMNTNEVVASGTDSTSARLIIPASSSGSCAETSQTRTKSHQDKLRNQNETECCSTASTTSLAQALTDSPQLNGGGGGGPNVNKAPNTQRTSMCCIETASHSVTTV